MKPIGERPTKRELYNKTRDVRTVVNMIREEIQDDYDASAYQLLIEAEQDMSRLRILLERRLATK